VVQVLLPSGRVDTDRLKVTVLESADPHVGPRGRYPEVLDPLKGVEVLDPLAVEPDVFEAATSPPTGDAGRRAIDSSQARHRCS
jgi:hypothetical protein